MSRRLTAIAIALASALGPTALAQERVAEAGDPALLRLESLARELGDPDDAARARAAHALGHLDASMLPAVRARIAYLRRHRPTEAWAFDIFTRIRRGAGSTRADDEVDIEAGVLPALAMDRSQRTLLMVEPVLLMRSCERLRSFESIGTMLPLFGLDAGGVWRWESRRVAARLGADAMAAALVAQRHEDAEVRSWARLTVERLGAAEPGRAIQGLTDRQLADVLRAYAILRVQSAMRIIVAFAGSERRLVRHAARWALDQYGANAIWILRTAYHERVGEQVPREWGWRRVADELYQRLDDERLAPVRNALGAARRAAERNDMAELERRLDDVLARAIDLDNEDFISESYARVAEWHFGAGRLDAARRDWARALRVAPESPQASRWRAQAALVEAEQRLAAGVLDVQAYQRVAALDPGNETAARTLELVRAQGETPSRRAGWIAGALLLLLALALLWPRRVVREEVAETEPPEDTLAESTSPG